MKAIGILLFGCAMYLLAIFSAIMLSGVSDWYLWGGTIFVGFIAGTIASFYGLILLFQNNDSKKKDDKE